MKSWQTECGGWTRGAGGGKLGYSVERVAAKWRGMAEQRNFWVAERGKMWYN